MSSQSLQVIVDDSIGDTSLISYTGKWELDTYRTRAREHDTSVHCTTSTDASVTFNFYGSSVLLAGTLYQGSSKVNIAYSIDSDPSIPRQSTESPDGLELRRTWLEEPNLSNGPHSVTAALVEKGNHFCVDYFLYTITLEDAIQQKKPVTVFVDDSDPSGNITYSDSWTPRNGLETMDGTDHLTSILGSNATFEFYGTYVAVYGNAFPGTPATIEYSLDGETPIQATDTVKSLPTFGRKLFYRDNMQEGYHKLVITLQNNANFSLDYITYQPYAVPSSASSTPPSLLPTRSIPSSPPAPSAPSSSPSIENSHPTNTGAIAGGVVGGVLGLAAILLAILFYLRHRKRQRDAQLQPSIVQPYVDQPNDIVQPMSYTTYPSSSASSYPLPGELRSAYHPL